MNTKMKKVEDLRVKLKVSLTVDEFEKLERLLRFSDIAIKGIDTKEFYEFVPVIAKLQEAANLAELK